VTSLGPNYRRFWSASALSNLADGVFQVALPVLAIRLTHSPALVAGVALANRLPWLLFALQAGALADRLDRKRTMVNVDVARALLIGTLAAVTAAGSAQLWVLYLVALCLGVGETLFDTAAQSVMPSVVDRDELSRANGRLYAVELTMNQFVGPPLGGVLAAIAVAAAFGFSAASYLVAAAALLLVTGSFKPKRTGPRTTLRTDIAEGVRYLWNHRLLRTLAFMVGVMNLASTATYAVFPLFALDPGPMGLSEFGFGVILTSTAVGSLLGSLATARVERMFGRHRLLMITLVASGPPLALTATANVPVVVGSGLLLGFGVVMWNVVTVSLRQRIVPDQLLGRVNAGYRLLAWGTMPIGAFLGGLLGELAGVRAVFVVSGAACALLLFLKPLISDEAIEAAEREGDEAAAAVAAAAAVDAAAPATP
jgi:MFS family permease